MTTPKHTDYRAQDILAALCGYDAAVADLVTDQEREMARRIAATLNACAGLPTEALESGALAKALEAIGSAYTVVAAVSNASDVDRSEWRLHRHMAETVLEPLYASLRALGRLP